MVVFVSDLFHSAAARAKPIRDNRSWRSVPFRGFLQKPKRSGLIPGFGDVALQDFTFMIAGSPETILNAINLHKDFVEMPSPLSVLAHV